MLTRCKNEKKLKQNFFFISADLRRNCSFQFCSAPRTSETKCWSNSNVGVTNNGRSQSARLMYLIKHIDYVTCVIAFSSLIGWNGLKLIFRYENSETYRKHFGVDSAVLLQFRFTRACGPTGVWNKTEIKLFFLQFCLSFIFHFSFEDSLI